MMRVKVLLDSIRKIRSIPQFALPDNHKFPTPFPKDLLVSGIPLLSSFQFRPPITRIGFRHPAIQTIRRRVLVPKAPVNEYHFAPLAKDYIRRTGQRTVVQTVTVAHTVNHTADGHLYRRIRAFYAAHIITAPLF